MSCVALHALHLNRNSHKLPLMSACNKHGGLPVRLQLQQMETEVTRTMDKVEEREQTLSSVQQTLEKIRQEPGTVPVSERLSAIHQLKEENAALRNVLDDLEVGIQPEST